MLREFFLLALVALLSGSVAAQTVSTLSSSMGIDGDGIVVAPSGDIYVAGGGSTSVVLKIAPDGTVSTFVKGIPSPVGIFMSNAGDFLVNNYRVNTVSRISPSGEVSLIATGMNGPAGIVANERGEVFVAEFGANFSGNGATVQRLCPHGIKESYIKENGLRDPIGIAIDEEENLYAANWNTGEIYKSDGETIALFAHIGGKVNQITYSNGHLYVPSPTLRKIFRISKDGAVTHIAGTGATGTKDGPAMSATFGRPNSIAAGPDGKTLYIVDAEAQSVRVLHLDAHASNEQQKAVH